MSCSHTSHEGNDDQEGEERWIKGKEETMEDMVEDKEEEIKEYLREYPYATVTPRPNEYTQVWINIGYAIRVRVTNPWG